jgi:hypothetical protein
MKIRREISRGAGVEVVVVAVDPVEAGAERFVTSVFVGDVADAEPERNLGVPRHNGPRGVECAMDVAQDPEGYRPEGYRPEGYRDDAGRVVAVVVVPGAGTSMSVLSQMKSLLL